MSNSKPDVILKWGEYQRYLDLEEEVNNADALKKKIKSLEDEISTLNCLLKIKDNLLDILNRNHLSYIKNMYL